MTFPLALLATVGLSVSAPAHAYRGARATVSIDNNLRGSVDVFVDGVYYGQVRRYGHSDLRLRPGTHAIRLVNSRFNCVLSASVIDLPPMSQIELNVTRRCDPRAGAYDYHRRGHRGRNARWDDPMSSWGVGYGGPSDVRFVNVWEHAGVVYQPVVVSFGRFGPPPRGGRGYRGPVVYTDGVGRGGNGRRGPDGRRWDDDRGTTTRTAMTTGAATAGATITEAETTIEVGRAAETTELTQGRRVLPVLVLDGQAGVFDRIERFVRGVAAGLVLIGEQHQPRDAYRKAHHAGSNGEPFTPEALIVGIPNRLQEEGSHAQAAQDVGGHGEGSRHLVDAANSCSAFVVTNKVCELFRRQRLAVSKHHPVTVAHLGVSVLDVG